MALAGAIQSAVAGSDHEAIRSLILHTWDKPEPKLVIDPIVVEADYAIAGWTQGERGGRALLRKEGGAWKVVLCSGDPLQSASVLVDAGLPAAVAERLSDDLRAAERSIDPKRVALFATFEGVMRMNAGSEHHKPH